MAKKSGKSSKIIKKSPVSKRPAASKAAKKAPVKKAAAPKKTVKKAAPKKASRAAIRPAPKAVPAAVIAPVEVETVSVPSVPARAPTRKIFGANNKVISVADKIIAPAVTASAEPAETEEAKEPIGELSAPPLFSAAPKVQAPAAPQPKIEWTALPQYLPAHIRFLVTAAIKESEQAAASPFPFAKFISTLPQELCGLEFAILILSLDHDAEEISQICGISRERAEGLISTGGTAITDRFAALCPEMYRKWRAQLAGRSISVESLIEHHLVSQIDKSFQAMLGAVLLSALGIKSPLFTTPLIAANLGHH